MQENGGQVVRFVRKGEKMIDKIGWWYLIVFNDCGQSFIFAGDFKECPGWPSNSHGDMINVVCSDGSICFLRWSNVKSVRIKRYAEIPKDGKP